MVKISSILPSTARVTSTDMQDAHPVRPGVPTFGRPVGRSGAAHFRASNVRGIPMDDIHTEREYRHAKLINDMTSDFFMRKAAPARQVAVDPMPVNVMNEQSNIDDSYETEQPEFIRSGQYLDVDV